MSKKNSVITLRITHRELATILAALRFHQDENLQGKSGVPDRLIKEIATDGGLLEPLDLREVGGLCERLNTSPAAPIPEIGDLGLVCVRWAGDVGLVSLPLQAMIVYVKDTSREKFSVSKCTPTVEITDEEMDQAFGGEPSWDDVPGYLVRNAGRFGLTDLATSPARRHQKQPGKGRNP